MRDDVYANGEHGFVEKWWVATNEGQPESQFPVRAEKNFEQIMEKGVEAEFYWHHYKVVERYETKGDTIVRCVHSHAEHVQ